MKKLVPATAILVPDQAELAFKGIIFDTYQWQQPQFDGSQATFEMLKRPDTVVVIAVVDDKLLVIDDEQPHAGSRLGFCGGRVDTTDASVLAAAQREAAEETGYEFANWRLIQVYQPHVKLEWFVHVLLASNVTAQQKPHLDAGEKIQVKLLPFDEVKQLTITRAGYLGEEQELFQAVDSLEELLASPQFEGKEVDR